MLKQVTSRAWRTLGYFAGHTACALLLCGWAFAANDAPEEWLSVPTQSLEIAAGSPLDFSGIVPGEPAGSQGWLTARADGTLGFGASSPPARFGCATQQNGAHISYAFPTHAEADRYALQLRRHGYNLVRFQYIDTRLMYKKTIDYDFDPEAVDRLYYLLAALKRNGIYWGIDLMSDPWGGLAKPGRAERSPDQLKLRINFDPKAREEWLRLVDLLYGRINPYTGKTTLADPALAFVVAVNENSLPFWQFGAQSQTQPFPTGFGKAFNRWLRLNYGSTVALRAVLPELGADESIADGTVRLPSGWKQTGPRQRLLFDFVNQTEIDTWDWIRARLRERGFQSPILMYNDVWPQNDNVVRNHLPTIDIHGYVGGESSYKLPSKWGMKSSFENDLSDYLHILSPRWLTKPLTITEYGHFWANPYRYEAGIVLPSLAAFQGLQILCRTAHSSIEMDIPPPPGRFGLLPLSIGLDPIARAGETLSALLFTRGDVSEGHGMLGISFGPREFKRLGSAILPSEVAKAKLLTRSGFIPEDAIDSLPQSAVVVPLQGSTDAGTAANSIHRAIDKLVGGPDHRLREIEATLRAKGQLSSQNETDVDRHLFVSDTDQIRFDGASQTFTVITPRTEAIAISGTTGPQSLAVVKILDHSPKVLISASALDDQPLANSRRILLILAGDARNTGMSFQPDDPTVVTAWGKLPIVMNRKHADIDMLLRSPGPATFSALSFTGDIMSSRPIGRRSDGGVRLSLDTASRPDMPTTYFLLTITE